MISMKKKNIQGIAVIYDMTIRQKSNNERGCLPETIS